MSGDTCSASSCAPGYTGSPLGTITCSNGEATGKLRGCAVLVTKRPCTPDMTMASGTKCIAQSCASGYIGTPSGTLSCTDVVLKGALVGCSTPAPCNPPKVPAYATDCSATMTSGTTCGASACTFGFAGKPSGTLSCTNGAIKKKAAAPARRSRHAL